MAPKMEKAVKLLMTISMITNLTLITIIQTAALDTSVSKLMQVGDESINHCDLTTSCDTNQLSAASYHSYFDKSNSKLGLDPDLLEVNQIAVGFVPAFKVSKGGNYPDQINAKLPVPMSIVGDYIAITSWDPELRAIDWHLPIIQKLDGKPVWCIALQPVEGLESITPSVAQKIAKKLAWVNHLGVSVWCRFGHEANGNWTPWGMKPHLFKEKWTLLARAVKAVAKDTYMFWSPNVRYGDSVRDNKGYLPYWPDDSTTVDIVGCSFYHWGEGYKRKNIAPTQAEAVTKLAEFAKIFGPGGWGKPVVVAETAACYTYYQNSNTPVEGHDDEIKIKMTWLHLLLDAYIKRIVPGLTAVIWFEVIKNENATGNTPVRTEDFRLVVGNPQLSQQVQQLFRNYRSKELQLLE